MKLLLTTLLSIGLSLQAVAVSMKIKVNGQPATSRTKISLGDTVAVMARGSHLLNIRGNYIDKEATGFKRGSVSMTVKVGEAATKEGYIRFCVDSKDDDNIGQSGPGDNIDATECFHLDTLEQPKKKPQENTLTYEIFRNSKRISKGTTVVAGDLISVTAKAKHLVKIRGDFTTNYAATKFKRKLASASAKVSKAATDAGYIRFCIDEKASVGDDNPIIECFSLPTRTKTHVADATPGTIDSIEVNIDDGNNSGRGKTRVKVKK